MVGDGGEAPQAGLAGDLAGDPEQKSGAKAGEDRDLLTLARALLREDSLGVALLDEEMRYIAINEGLAALQGAPPEAHIGRTPTEVLERVSPELLDRMRRVLETGDPIVHQEEALDPGTGKRRYWTVSFRRVDREGGGRALAVFIRETTEQKEIESRERDARRDLTLAAGHVARLQAVTAALSEARTPTQVASVVMNQGVAALGGSMGVLMLLSPDGDHLELLAHRGLLEGASDRYRRIPLSAAFPLCWSVRTGTPDWFESNADYAARYPETAGRIVSSDVTQAVASIPLIVNGVTIGGLGISFAEPRTFDEGERFFVLTLARQCAQALDRARLYEEAQEANRSKDEFLSVLSHELRTPLNAILGWAGILLAKGGDPATVARGIQVIERNARAQARIIEDILDVSRIITGKLRLERRPLDLVSVVKASVEVLRPMADAKQVEISGELSAALPLILGDADRLQQVAWNLLSNAIKFTPKGGHIEIRVDGSGSSALLSVSDTGPGISPDFLPFVFDRFRQADSSSSRAHGGLGLGLAIVRHIVEMHGGSVSVESPGALQREGAPGATFKVSLPLLELDEEDGGPAAARISFTEIDPASGPRDLRGLRVLLVDDEADARELLVRVLREGGADVRASGSAAEALLELEVFRPDVLVSDIGMPGEDGLALLRKVRALPPPLGRVPAVALTAYARPEDARKAFLAGFQMHVSKPIEAASLMAVVANLGGRVALDL